MPLESTIICVDNSEYMRNGDYIPNRLQAQQDAVNTLCRYKLLANPENNVGLLTLAKTEVLATLTTDGGKILTSLHKMQPEGFINLLTGIRIAHLALKHRQSKNHKMRIIVFVGSPVSSEEKDVIKIGKRLKKENVNVDVINFGETEENQKVLESFVNTINGREGTASHLVTIPPSPHLANALMSSPIIVQGEDGSGAATSFSGGGGFDFGVDPNEDPELALALRVSMEEQRQRQQEEERRSAPVTAEGEATAAPAEKAAEAQGAEDTADKAPAVAGEGGASEEEMLQQALAMSMEGGAPAAAATATATAAPPKAASATKAPAGGGFPDFSAMTEEEQIAYAMQISMQGSSDTSKEEPMEVDAKADQEAPPDFSQVMSDPAFLHDVLQSLPGVDAQSSALRQAVGSLATKEKKEEGDAKKEEDEQKKKDKK